MDSYNYFRSYKNYFWQWEDNGEVIAIPDEATIAYKNQVVEILERLAPQGLPPFGSLLLAIIATNANADAALDAVYVRITRFMETTDDVVLAKAMIFLKRLATMPQEYKQGDKRALLLQVLFKGCHNINSIKDSKAAYEFLKSGSLPLDSPVERVAGDTRELKIIALMDSRFNSVDLIIKAIGGLPDKDQIEIDFDHTPGENSSAQPDLDLIDQLIANSTTFTVGSLVRWLWGGLNIPVHSALPSAQPLGGISDLTNKGDFDKLLVSEFANDDLFFMSRLANNEALYIHREIPPAHNDLHRIILIDASMKCWGTPKAMAFATLLAIAKHPKTDIDCQAFVLGAEKYYPVSFENMHTIIDAMDIVAGTLHCSGGLAAFFNDHGKDKNKEVFFITEASTLKQGALLKTMTENHQHIHYQVLTDVEGNIDVYKRHKNSKKHLQHIKLPLDTLWKKEKPKKVSRSAIKETKSTVGIYPILIRDAGHAKKVLVAPNGQIFQVSGNKAIFRFYDKTKEKHAVGWDLVFENLPFNTNIAEVGLSEKGEYVFLLFNANTREVLLVNISTGEKQRLTFDQWRSNGTHSFIFETGKFVHYHPGGAWTITLDGKVDAITTWEIAKFKARADELAAVANKYTFNTGVFKNIHQVFINSAGQLIFNKHALMLEATDKSIRFLQSSDRAVKINARRISDVAFEFPDGSLVEVNRLGLITLKSSTIAIPAVYVPSLIDSPLGVATLYRFAGNEFYYKEPLFEIVLQNAGPQLLATIKTIRANSEMSLKEVKTLAENTPAVLPVYFKEQSAVEIKEKLEEIQAEVEVRRIHHLESKMEKISTTDFFGQHIAAFIKNILDHGA
ncbi:ribosomal protein L7/L12 [Chryseolinea soli]|uniref:Uncharacterized protein n=1 Tax=Chryseolinea soli TaxID=2321403 RepID=A0A385SKB1_9BACT|nr:ribosomal protein L7/L12 [Chryseolinea soli]AYB32193.1 hypothetical protein D4L85_17150 [Chryseolinea soli]